MPDTLTYLGRASGPITPSRAGVPFALSWMSDSAVPRQHRRSVQRRVDALAARLGLGSVKVRWFGPPVDGGDFTGIAPDDDMLPLGMAPDDQPDTIALWATLDGPALEAVIAHELGHLANRRRPRAADAERGADAYALEVLNVR